MGSKANDILLSTSTLIDSLATLIVSYAFSTVGAILILIIGWIASSLFSRWTESALGRVRGLDATVINFLGNIVRYGVLIIVVVMVLGQFGVQTTSIIAALGAAGLAIGLALQGTLQNIAAGIMLLVLRPFRNGEYIDAGNVSGIVQQIGLFATEFRTPDGLYRLAPNSSLWNVSITNYSRQKTRRNDLTIGIGYEDDIELAQSILMDMANGDERVLADPAAETFVAELGDSAVSITLRYWTMSADWWPTSRHFTKTAKLEFDKRGISIPFPQVTYTVAAADGTPAPVDKEQDKTTG
ncbi:mechanosensitive ion channel family protein [Rhizobium sp. PAMB 3182]